MSERRIQPRFEVCLDVRWQGSATNYNVRIADMSEGGCYIDTILEVTKGEILSLSIMMPDHEWLELEAVVAHHFPRLGFGVRFVNSSEAQRRQIRSLIYRSNPTIGESSSASLPYHPGPETPLHW
ncbi:MAG TPA: PilZ domain-containing protein [Pyrinomonadaceae bacterium]|nr:PilZ domain-containing protein [Pyrinomonadaceae bacterium]